MNLLDILFPKRKQEKEELKNLEPEIKIQKLLQDYMEELILKFITIHYMNEIEEEYMISRVEKNTQKILKR